MNDNIIQHIFGFCDIDTQLSLRKAYANIAFKQKKLHTTLHIPPIEFYDLEGHFLHGHISYPTRQALKNKNYVYSSLVSNRHTCVLQRYQIVNQICEDCNYPCYYVYISKDHPNHPLGNITIFTPIGKVCMHPLRLMYKSEKIEN
jgi:hypothetical protein